jgi:hypothetical protein
LKSGGENVSSIIQVLVVVNLPSIVLQVVVLLSSFLMNGAELYASRMMLLLATVSASALGKCSSLLTMRLDVHYQLSAWVRWFASLDLLELIGLEEVNKYYSPSSILVIKLISVETMDSAFLGPLRTGCSLLGFNCF